MNKAVMEHRGEKYSNNEKDNPAAPSWSQNGATEEEYGCSDGPGEERRVKSGSRAAKPAEKQPRLNFHIPRKSREKRALFQNVSTDSREFSDILQILTSCYKDSSSTGMFVYSKPRLVHSEPLEKDFMEKRRELKADGRTEKELSETFCFLLSDAQKVSVVCEKGLSVGSSWINMLGNPSKGVYLCQFSDLLQINPFEPGTTGDIIIFKVIKGRVKSVHDCISRYPDNRTSRGIDPTPKFDSHFSKSSTRVTSLLSHMAFEYTQQYFYEYVDFEISSRPRHVCPYAVVSYYFKGKEASTVIPKPLPPFRSNSQPAGTSLGRHCYTVWRGHFVNGGKDVYQACLRSLSQPFLPYKLPEKIEIGKVMRLQQVKQKIPSSIFSWNLYTGSHEVFKSGMVCSLFDVVEEDKSPKSLRALMQKLEEEGLVLVNMVKDRGFLFLLSVGQLTNSSERRNGWKMSSMQALFVYSEKRGTLKSSSNPSESCNPVSSDFQSSMMPQHDSFISALHYSLSKSRSDPPAELGTTIEHQVYDYLTNLCEGKPVQRIRTDYDPKLDVREKLFPAPRQKNNWESFMRPYIFNPAKFTMVQENMKKKVEQLQFQPDQSTRKAASQNDPVKVKELLKLIQMNRKGSQGETGSPEAMEGTCTLKRKVDLDDHEESSKRHRNQSTAEEGEMQTSPTLTNVLSSAGLQDTDLRKDKNQGALKVIEMLDSFGKTSLDTDLRKDKAQGVLEVIKLIDTLTRGATQSSEDTEMKDTIDVSDAALFNSMSRLGLPTDRDIDLRKRFRNDEPEKPDSLEEETAGSLSSLEAFSPCSDSGGQQRGVNLLGEKTIPWVLIPITGLKTERYSQRKKDYPEDPRFLQSPTVSTHNTPDIKDLSPTYQPDSSNTVADLDVQTTAEVEDDDPVTPSVNTSTEALANAAPPLNGVDHIVDELISGFSSEVEQILRGNNIYYVSCLNNQSSREPPQAPVPPLSDYVLNFTTPFPVCNYVSSLHDRMMKFIHGNQHSEAQEDVSSSSLPTEDPSDVPDTSSNVCASSSSTTKPNKSFEFHLRPCLPSSALPEPVTQAQHQSGLPDVHKLPQKIWPLEQDSVAQQITEASIIDDLKQGSHEVSGSSVAETMEADEGQMSCSAVPAEDASMDHTHSAISSIIHQLQPEMITNLVEILKGVQKNTVYFYIHSLEEESDVCWEIKEYLKKLGDLECNPQGFLEKKSTQDKLLVIIQNMDIAAQVHKIPSLVSLKKHPSVSFAGVDNLSDIQNHTYNELFQAGGFIVSDEDVLNPSVITAEKLQDILECIEQLSSPQNPWRWRVHFKSHKKLREQSRLKTDALKLYEILCEYEKRHIVEILSYHDCDTPARRAPDLGCLVDLQARFSKQRHLIFLTGFQFEMFPHYSSSGIVIANVDDVKFVISCLASEENMDDTPSADMYPTPAPASLGEDSMSMDSNQDSSDNTVSATAKMTHVLTEQQPDLQPFFPENTSQDQVHTIPVHTTTTETPNVLDFKALSEAISQFKASKMLAKAGAGETSFQVDPHQSFLGHSALSDSYTLNSPEIHSLPETLVSYTSNQMELANKEMSSSAASHVEPDCETDQLGEIAVRVKPATSTLVAIAPAEISNNPEHWEQSNTSSADSPNNAESSQELSEHSISENPPVTSAMDTGQASTPSVKNTRASGGFLPRPSNSTYGMDCFYPTLQQQGGLMPAPQTPMGLSYPRFVSHNSGIGLRHPLVNCTLSNKIGVIRAPVLGGFLPAQNVQMSWNNLAQHSATGLWGARYGMDVQQMHRSTFIQNWQGNPSFQGNSYRPNRGGFGGW